MFSNVGVIGDHDKSSSKEWCEQKPNRSELGIFKMEEITARLNVDEEKAKREVKIDNAGKRGELLE